MKRFIQIAVMLFISSVGYAQHEYEMVKLSDNLYQFYQKDFVNMFAYIGAEGVVLIDSGFDDIAESVKKELAVITDKPINYIINTHSDYDHLAGNMKLRENAVVIAHSNCTTDLIEYSKPEHPNPFDRKLFVNAMPDITFDEEMEIFLGDEKLILTKAIGGHTSSDIVVYLQNMNVAFIGDIFFTDSFPHVKDQTGVSIENLLKVIDLVLALLPEDVIIYVGHGYKTNIEKMKSYKEMIEKTTSIVKAEIVKGKTLEEIKEGNVLKDWSMWSGTVFEEVNCEMWIETIYNNYKNQFQE